VSRRAVAVALAAVAAAAGAAEPAPGARLALEPLRVRGVALPVAQLVEERVCAALGERPGVDVVCPSDVAAAAALARNAVAFGQSTSDDALKRIDAVKAADRRVTGDLEKGEKGMVLSLQLTTAAGAGPKVSERLPDDLDALVARIPALVKRLFP
jgi:hypothetical protein